VAAVTEDSLDRDYGARKAALRRAVRAGGLPAELIFAADKVARLRVADERGELIEGAKLDHYQRSLRLVASGHRLRSSKNCASVWRHACLRARSHFAR
jgi:hypothetical protein